MMKLKHVKIAPGVSEVDGTDAAERFHLSASKKNADVVTINGFELGVDKLHYGKVNADGFTFTWIQAGDDGLSNDLEIMIGDQTFILTDLGDQVDDPVETRYERGFETGTEDWFDTDDGWTGMVTQVASGTNGIDAFSGDFYAVIESDDPVNDAVGPYTNYGGHAPTPFEAYTVSMAVYLDTSADGSGWAAGEGFDFSVATNKADDSTFLRDFIFHVTQDTSSGDLLINASNNTNFAPREDLDTLADTAVVAEDGWYTFQHHFYENGSGDLAVDLTVLDDAEQIVFTKTLTNPADDITDVNGEPRYGWFTAVAVDGGVAIDDVSIAYDADQVQQLPDPDDIFFV